MRDAYGRSRCTIAKCDNMISRNGMCEKHYRQHKAGVLRGQRLCGIEGCDRPHRARGMCGVHWKRWDRGTLDRDPNTPRYGTPRSNVGKPIEWPYEFQKVDGIWYRRPTDSNDEWKEVSYGLADTGSDHLDRVES